MKSQEIRQKFLRFFQEKGHKIIPSASLIPEHDPTVLFISAGMQPLVPYLLGEKHPEGKRLVNVQKCLRTDDIEEVGDTYHHTFFEMLGNWSLGYRQATKVQSSKSKVRSFGVPLRGTTIDNSSYWKEEAIKYSWEFLTDKKWLGIDKNKIAVTCFAGDKDAPRDTESEKIWLRLGIPKERIVFLGKEDNWWGPIGEIGPCGPDTEIFVWIADELPPRNFDPKDERWVEVWNDVFMEYDRIRKQGNKEARKQYEYIKLKQKNVDTGMGLERVAAVMQGTADDYQTDLFLPIIGKIEEFSGKKYLPADLKTEKRAFRIIADHLRAAVFILGDENKIEPSNIDRGYVLRRLIRRAIRYGRQLEIKENFVSEIAKIVIRQMQSVYPELKINKDFIIAQLEREEEKFAKTLERGLKEFERIIKRKKKITGEESFLLFQSFGFPYEMTEELSREKGIKISKEDFEKEYKKHQELSRTASAGMFKGGLAEAGEQTTKYHTATHLLLAALKRVLEDPNIEQKGSNITTERLRFDFNYPQKLTEEQIKKVENLVNEQIKMKLPVDMMEMTLEEAKNIGATGVFEAKYGEKVKVYKIGEFSLEICGGPHVKNTGELGHFKIIKEGSSGAGIRRIKAVLE